MRHLFSPSGSFEPIWKRALVSTTVFIYFAVVSVASLIFAPTTKMFLGIGTMPIWGLLIGTLFAGLHPLFWYNSEMCRPILGALTSAFGAVFVAKYAYPEVADGAWFIAIVVLTGLYSILYAYAFGFREVERFEREQPHQAQAG